MVLRTVRAQRAPPCNAYARVPRRPRPTWCQRHAPYAQPPSCGHRLWSRPVRGRSHLCEVSAGAQQSPNEAKEILKDFQKQDPETPKELAECMKQWGPNTQMTKEEWAASCRSTLHYFPEKP